MSRVGPPQQPFPAHRAVKHSCVLLALGALVQKQIDAAHHLLNVALGIGSKQETSLQECRQQSRTDSFPRYIRHHERPCVGRELTYIETVAAYFVRGETRSGHPEPTLRRKPPGQKAGLDLACDRQLLFHALLDPLFL